ncbi:hypothetical protein BH11PLA1_BH11PLA1_08100 [soil metagenome]
MLVFNRSMGVSALVVSAFGLAGAQAQTPVAAYYFQNTLASSVGGPTLVAVDPLAQSGFEDALISGNARRVYRFSGSSGFANNAGLTLDTSTLIAPNVYSVEMVLSMDATTGYRRLIDVANRSSDTGAYYDPNNHLDVYNVAAGATTVDAPLYNHVVYTVGAGTITAYLNGVQEFSVNSALMDINNPANLLTFFLDDGINEYSSGRIALLRVYNQVLTGDQVATLAQNPFIPAPGTALLASLGILATARRRR